MIQKALCGDNAGTTYAADCLMAYAETRCFVDGSGANILAPDFEPAPAC
jgi:hypothetical protein